MEVNYEKIKPIIVSETLEGTQMKVKFKAQGQDDAIESVGMMIADQEQMMKGMKKTVVKSAATNVAFGALGTFIRSMFGGVAGHAAGSAVNAAGGVAASKVADPNKMMQVEDTPENRQKAVLNAFQSVSSLYEWDATANIWKFKAPEIPKTEG
jgi:hypothetical protein